MYKCNECEKLFDKPIEEQTTYESYYGVNDLFQNLTPMKLCKCPHCNSESFKEISTYNMEDIITYQKDLIDEIKYFNKDYEDKSIKEIHSEFKEILRLCDELDDLYCDALKNRTYIKIQNIIDEWYQEQSINELTSTYARLIEILEDLRKEYIFNKKVEEEWN